MSISAEVPERSPSRVLAEATATLRALSETLWSARSDGELVESVEQVQLLVAAVAAVESGAVAEAHVRRVARHPALRLDGGLADPHRGSPARRGQAAGGPGHGPDRAADPYPRRPGGGEGVADPGRCDRGRGGRP